MTRAGQAPRIRLRGLLAPLAAVVLVLALAGCGSAAPSEPAGAIEAPAVVTFEVAGQGTFKVELLTPELVEQAIALRDGTAVDRQTPIGTIVDGDGGVNAPWNWHLDPASFEFVDVAMEVCDGLPSHVEDKTLTSTYYCPWGPKVVSVTPR